MKECPFQVDPQLVLQVRGAAHNNSFSLNIFPVYVERGNDSNYWNINRSSNIFNRNNSNSNSYSYNSKDNIKKNKNTSNSSNINDFNSVSNTYDNNNININSSSNNNNNNKNSSSKNSNNNNLNNIGSISSFTNISTSWFTLPR